MEQIYISKSIENMTFIRLNPAYGPLNDICHVFLGPMKVLLNHIVSYV